MAQAQGRKVNWFAIWISVATVVALVVVAGVVVWMNSAATAPAARPDGSGISQETGAIVVGEGPNTVDVFFDFYCPHCQDFEEEYGPVVGEQLETGTITLNMHPVALGGLNSASGTDFSKRASNALYCVADDEPSAAYPFMVELMALTPSGPGLSDEELLALAEDAGSTGSAECIADRPWDDLVAEQTANIPANPATGSAGTPTLVVNGEYVAVTGNPQADLLDRLS
jgi:protein-disulfide isomerase